MPHLSMISPTEMTSVIPSGISFEDNIRKLFAKYTVSVRQEKAVLMDNVNSIDPSNPTQLLQFQNRASNYSLTMNMISTLTHKSVSAIDTVLKAQ